MPKDQGATDTMDVSASPAATEVVIIGGGILGCATAHYLRMLHVSNKGSSGKAGGLKITIVEQEGVACSSSGKAGGFLGRDWGSGAT